MKTGTKIGNHEVVRVESLDHLTATYIELVHVPTGARHIHIDAPDDNNVFMVAFPTVPTDSTGVPHILEHTVLRGSERFPVRDPQTALRSRSLNTFLNAMTSSDATFYPFSTRVEKDYFNLLQHYLGAAFFPLLEELAFRQEGHRLEFATPDDPKSPLQFKGVVFNEMKGANAAASRCMYSAMGESLFPGSTYSVNSGGDSAVIPDLTWEGLKQFHAHHYHPSNARFFTYGNLPLDKTLDEIERQALCRFDKAAVTSPIPIQPPFDAPKSHRATYPLGAHESVEKKSQILVAWKTVPVDDPYRVLCLRVLGEVLLSNAASPLRKALIDSGLGEALADGTGVGSAFREVSFGAGLKNVNSSDAGKVEALVLDTLDEIVKNGIDEELVEAAIHQIEISGREVSNAGAPFGLKLFFRLESAYLHGGDVFASINFEEGLTRLNRDRLTTGFFENLIRDLLIDNPHRVTILLEPDQQMTAAAEAEERSRLDAIQDSLSHDDAGQIVQLAAALKQRQDKVEDLSVLPSLALSDIPMGFEDVPHEILQKDGVRVGLFPQPTNGFSYVDIRVAFDTMQTDLVDYLPLLGYCITKIGAAGDDYLKVARRIERFTGGIHAHPSVREKAGGKGLLRSFTITGKALTRNDKPFVEILADLISAPKFDNRRLKDLIAEYKAQKESSVTSAGHQYAWLLSASKLGASQYLSERLSGLTQLAVLKRLTQLGEDLDEVKSILGEVVNALFLRGSVNVCVTAEPGAVETLEGLLDQALGSLDVDSKPVVVPIAPTSGHEARTTSVPVAFNGKSFRVPAMDHEDGAALQVLSHLLGPKFLHREIRQKGGAYGAFSIYDREDGVMAFVTYRDPHIVKTFETFDAALDFAGSDEVQPEWIEEAILEACRAIDPLSSPDLKGRKRFFDDLAGYTLELKEQYKSRLLKVNRDDLVRVAAMHLDPTKGSLATISDPEKVEEANAELGGIFTVSPI